MENNEISMVLDVKLDLKDKRSDKTVFRNWTKCNVKIEAIKCFPCYFRITFTKATEDENPDSLCVRINLPGLSVRFANSRSKAHSYGLFWKQNRKRCCIYFALETQLSCDRHMKWVKKSMKNLELYRQEIIETRRRSRSKPELSFDHTASLNELSGKSMMKNLRDVLGPLPKIPDFSDANWSRRMSGMSGIYEEIPDCMSASRRQSRNSFASGIYEEMKPVSTFDRMRESLIMSPPPLPPRTRIDTFAPETSEISRSHTNPESDLAKKKKYLTVLENMFGISKRFGSLTSSKDSLKTSPDKKSNTNPKKRKNILENVKLTNKRNSYSSPDLTKINYFDAFEALDDLSSVSSDLHMVGFEEVNASNEFIHLSPKSYEESAMSYLQEALHTDLNISEQIQPNFNFSCNLSTVNLVGASLNPEESSSVEKLNDFSGYCVMAPIKRDKNKSTNETRPEIVTLAPDSQNSSFDMDVYENMNALCTIYTNEDETRSKQTSDGVYQNFTRTRSFIFKNRDKTELERRQKESRAQEDSFSSEIYVNMNACHEINLSNEPVNENSEYQNLPHQCESPQLKTENHNEIKNDTANSEIYCKMESTVKTAHRKSSSVDDKIPSYYPNNCDNLKNRRRSSMNDKTKNVNGVKVTNKNENIYVASPENDNPQNETKGCDVQKRRYTNGLRRNAPIIKANKTSGNIYVVTKTPSKKTTETKVTNDISIKINKPSAVENVENIEKSEDNNFKTIASERSPRLYTKYATLARITPNKYLEKCAKKSSEISNLKKFTSLPRFKKLDLSPLKTKITNVLQRHHSDGL